VRYGRRVGIFKSWAECKESVNGFSHSEFKSFPLLDDAEEFMRGAFWPTVVIDNTPMTTRTKLNQTDNDNIATAATITTTTTALTNTTRI
jgi:viroplasmin and RNaseH domain-containing protein